LIVEEVEHMKKGTVFVLSLIFFLLGVISGFFISPVKNGVVNTMGNNYHYPDKKDNSCKENASN
jgi:hypothetical protein